MKEAEKRNLACKVFDTDGKDCGNCGYTFDLEPEKQSLEYDFIRVVCSDCGKINNISILRLQQ